MICKHCGASSQANTGFCPSCGATVEAGTGDSFDWNASSVQQQASPVAAPTGDLLPVCHRPGVFRSSLLWIGVLVVCVMAATAVQISRRGGTSLAAQAPPPQAASAPQGAAPAAAAAVPASAPAENTLARMLKIVDVKEFVNQPEVAERLRQVLGPDLEEFQRDLSVSGMPVVVGDTITFTTCAPQACGVSEAAVSLATDTGTLIAALLANKHIRIYGAKSNKLEDCPNALQSWAQKLAQGNPGSFTYEMRSGEPPAPAAPASKGN